MAMIECVECKNKISDSAETCPFCGIKLKKNNKWYEKKSLIFLMLCLFFPVGLYGLIKNTKINKIVKGILIALFGFYFLIICVAIFATEATEPTNQIETSKNINEENVVKEEISNDPLRLGKETIKSLINSTVPYEKWNEWGTPETLDKTNNNQWVVYLPLANISFVSNKKTDKIVFANFDKESAINYITKIEDERTKKIEDHFSAWDGSHFELTQLIKNNMNDPKSYEHVETVYWDMIDHLIVQTKFRGNNAFGGKVLTRIKAKVSLDGMILEVLEQE